MKNLTLSLDISTTATGWALFEGSDLVESGVLSKKSINIKASHSLSVVGSWLVN